MDKGTVQFLLVAVPVLSLIGSWLALRTLGGRRVRPRDGNRTPDGATDKVKSE